MSRWNPSGLFTLMLCLGLGPARAHEVHALPLWIDRAPDSATDHVSDKVRVTEQGERVLTHVQDRKSVV